MKKFFSVPFLLALTGMLFSSCLKNNEEDVTLHNDAAITMFVLGSLTQTNPSTGATNTLTGSNYIMAIDQINYTISNNDSLPVGTAVNSVLASVSTMNSGGLAIKNLNDSLFTWYSSTVAIDFSKERIFRVFATDGSYYRDYKVKVNVKNSSSTTFWTAKSDTTLLGGFANMRVLSIDSTLVVLGATASETSVCTSLDKGKTWKKQDQTFDADAWRNAVASGDSVFVLSNNKLFVSKDLKQWSSMDNTWDLKQLVGADSKELFALTSTYEMKAAQTKDLNTWNTEQMDNSISADSIKKLLTLNNMAYVSFPYTSLNNTDYVLLVGNDGTNTVVWRKISQYANSGNTGKWVNIPAGVFNKNLLPKQTRLSLMYLDSKVFAVGSDTPVYLSTDQGISWHVNTSYTLPIAMQTATIDADGVMWGISVQDGKGKVWRGKYY